MDLYDLSNAKPGKNNSKWFVLQGAPLFFSTLR